MKQVRWTGWAAADLEQIVAYLDEREPAVAPLIANKIFDAVESLARMPHRGHRGRTPGTRELIVPGLPYILIYRVRREAVIVDNIVHAAQRR